MWLAFFFLFWRRVLVGTQLKPLHLAFKAVNGLCINRGWWNVLLRFLSSLTRLVGTLKYLYFSFYCPFG